MQIETINKLYLELSQVATATTSKESDLILALREANEVLRSAHEIALRDGAASNWPAFRARLAAVLAAQHRILYPVSVNYAWVIERAESESSAPEYCTSYRHAGFLESSAPRGVLEWSEPGNHIRALRFSRREDAERFAKSFDPGRNHRVVEHGWDE